MEPIKVKITRAPRVLKVRSSAAEFTFETDADIGAGGNSAAIISLPVAMRAGRDMHVAAPVCPVLRAGLERLSVIWSAWKPELFQPIRISSDGDAEPTMGRGLLMAYSGGVDSTHALSRLHREEGLSPDLMTVLGMDYRRGDTEKFDRLMKRTQPLREARAGEHLVVRSDAASVLRRVGVESFLGFGFQIFACFHLFADRYEGGALSADHADWQELLIGPYGATGATNRLFGSAGFGIRTLDPSMTRGEKVAAIADDDLALSALSFCKDYAVRPENCGVCSKCMRTKAMFFAATGAVPPIFLDSVLDTERMQALDLSRRNEQVFAMDLVRIARANGREADFAKLAEAIRAPSAAPSAKQRLYKYRMLLRSRLLGRR
ncbi:hypothetical protein [Limimaricola litoreus]|uniref:Uncharacterized protein n=1 Tax=Limimaricola litoreus TaxID=2955316 RepID=A0A9X2FNN5_9RHOB|nr:hypothetical protein [Limimaricola litoreus]MCP1168514.1 hypothetical protein [Limimaricola litoreus]